MRAHLIVNSNFDEFQDGLNYRLAEIESEDSGGRIIDVKFEMYPSESPHLCALILWESKDAEDKTRTRLREECYRGRYKTW